MRTHMGNFPKFGHILACVIPSALLPMVKALGSTFSLFNDVAYL